MSEKVEIDLLELVLKQQEEIKILTNQNLINTSHINMLKTEVDKMRNDNIFYDYRGQVTARQKIEHFNIILDDLQNSNVSNLVHALSILIPCLADKLFDEADKLEIMSKLIQDLNGDRSYFKIDVRSNVPPKDDEMVVRLIASMFDVSVESVLALYK